MSSNLSSWTVLENNLKHLAHGTLGLKHASRRTIRLGALFVMFGLGLGPTVIEHLFDLQFAGEPHRAWTALGMFVALCVMGLGVVLSYWWDRRAADQDEREREGSHVTPSAAVVLTLSEGEPSEAFVTWLEGLEPETWLRELRHLRPGRPAPPDGHPLNDVLPEDRRNMKWVELMARLIAYHGTHLESITLLLGQERLEAGEAAAIRRVAERLLALSGRERAQVEFHGLKDVFDAARIRRETRRALEEVLRGRARHEVSVNITLGPTSTSVGMVLAAAELEVEVEYFPLHRPEPKPGAAVTGYGFLPHRQGVWGPIPVTVGTLEHRRRMEDG